ncbi:MAG: response regulator [Deltaproteobacteria bacterium]|nr:response regulator [Deltaproteobacteria bacterium]
MGHLLDWPRGRAGIVLVGTTLLLIVFIGFLLVATVLSHRRVQHFAREQFRRDTEGKAMALSYYFSERKNDLKNLAESPAILSFFENKALGMSMEYGLAASLLRISEIFQAFLNERRMEGNPIYSDIVFIDTEGKALVTVPEGKERRAGMNWKDFLQPEQPDVAIIVEHEDPLAVMCSIPYFFKSLYAGQIVAWISAEATEDLAGADKTSSRLRYLICDRHGFSLGSKSGQGDTLKPDVVHRFDENNANGASTETLVFSARIKDTPLSLISVLPASEVGGGASVWHLPLGMGTLAVLILCGTVLAYRVNTQRLVLNTRLEEASRAREEIEAKNRAMNSEIVERRKAEEALKELSTELEEMVARRTAALSTTIEELNQEVKERKQAEERLKASEAKTRRIIEAAPVGICIHQQGRYVYVNPAFVEVFGYENVHEIEGQPVESLFFPEDRDLVRERGRVRLAAEKEVPLTYEIRALKKEGKVFPVVLGGAAIDYDGEPAILGFVMDVSAERDLRRQLLASQKMEALGTLAGGIAHDFNNILSAVIGYAELARMKLPKESDVMPDLDEVRKAGDRAKNLVKQILTAGRQTEEECGPMKPIFIVKEVLKLLRASIPTSIQFDEKLDKDAGDILADSTRIHQILMNLCTNARHAMREKGGILTVRLENVEVDPDDARAIRIDPGPSVRLTVGDTGPGMAPEVMDRIFEPYYTTKEKGEGTGLGLAVVHGIIESYGGKIAVYSEPEKGTTFHVYFPRIDAPSQEAAGAAAPAVLPTGAERILFVDDEAPLAKLGKRVLENLVYKVTALRSSMEALRHFSEDPNRSDLVITDLTMPDMTGDRLAQEMLKIRPGMPIIIYSGFVEKSVRQRVKSTGARAFIEKPLTAEKLARTVREVLDRGIGG